MNVDLTPLSRLSEEIGGLWVMLMNVILFLLQMERVSIFQSASS